LINNPTMTADRDDCGQLDHPQGCRTGGGQPLMICTAASDLKGATRRCAMCDGLRLPLTPDTMEQTGWLSVRRLTTTEPGK
jgi:hypothetical protein